MNVTVTVSCSKSSNTWTLVSTHETSSCYLKSNRFQWLHNNHNCTSFGKAKSSDSYVLTGTTWLSHTHPCTCYRVRHSHYTIDAWHASLNLSHPVYWSAIRQITFAMILLYPKMPHEALDHVLSRDKDKISNILFWNPKRRYMRKISRTWTRNVWFSISAGDYLPLICINGKWASSCYTVR